MLVGQQLGPFVIDKELGAGAMGAVYRGRYTKTGQLVAIKVMAPGLGDTKSGAVERFEREAEILKQFNHPNIVRLFGVGKHKGMRYFAMEYIQGESLDRVMARRGRMTWEEVVTLGQQLCLALQHAHEQGVIHRDLKPSNLMILPDGTVKLTDFGIAKDMDVTALTSANCTVGTAAYMSPEQCKGERDLTPKSDLYSMGVLFYELITGRKPFTADNAMEMFMQHVQGTFVRPAKLVLETPVWLDNLIAQLLEKKPEQRPRDASMVYNALGSIAEKVAAQKSAGVEAVRSRAIDRPKGERKLAEEDKDAARMLFHGKVRQVKKKKPKKQFYERVWVQAVGLLALLGGLVFALYVAFSPASPDKLYRKAERLMKTGKPEDQDKARAGPIKEYLKHYGATSGAQTEQIRRWADQIDAREYEEKLQKYLRNKQKRLPFEPQSDVERAAFAAADAEEAGDFERAGQIWHKLKEEEGRHSWGLVAERRLAELQGITDKENDLAKTYSQMHDLRREPPLEGLQQLAFLGFRAEKFGDYIEAKRRFQLLKEKSKDAGEHSWYLFANKKLHDIEKNPQEAGERDKHVKEQLAKAEAEQNTNPKDAYTTCLNIVALYADNEKFAPQVAKARDVMKAIDKFQGTTTTP